MSHHLAIARVTEALRDRVEEALHTACPGERPVVIKSRPEEIHGEPPAGPLANVFLYRATPAPGHQAPVPGPGLVLDLDYLVSFRGDHDLTIPERSLGAFLLLLESRPFVAGDAGGPHVPVTLDPLGRSELAALWHALTRMPYALTVAVRATGVRLGPAAG